MGESVTGSKILGTVEAVCLSEAKGTPKKQVPSIHLVPNHGVEGDAHAGPWYRQVSLLAVEAVEAQREKGIPAVPGLFAENITTRGMDPTSLPVGTRLKVGESALIEITQIGKTCHTGCAIFRQTGDCIMPRKGVFAKVLSEGTVRPGDPLELYTRFRVAILTASDRCSRGEREDLTAPALRETVSSIGDVIEYEVVPDEKDVISNTLVKWCDGPLSIDLILTTGGTGFAQRDVTPEATAAVVEKLVPGIPELMRAKGMLLTPKACLSRGIAGIRGKTLILNLPGSPKGARENLEAVLEALPHGLMILRGVEGDCGTVQ